MVIGIRGGLDESTTNVGQVYYSPKQFLNHSAVNPVFSFLSSMEKTASYVPDYQFMDDAACAQLMTELYPTESTAIDTLLTTQRPNVVVILMESCGAIFTGLEGRADVMPQLERLMQEGVSFDSCYANSWRTDRGTVCTYSGYPSFPVSSVMKMPSKSRLLPGLARTLAGEGYETSYIYGGDINFTNMRSYLVSTGFAQLTWKKDLYD
jgi:phosphoglycerol transferase MdoB-like AlkP superfamily enzyme